MCTFSSSQARAFSGKEQRLVFFKAPDAQPSPEAQQLKNALDKIQKVNSPKAEELKKLTEEIITLDNSKFEVEAAIFMNELRKSLPAEDKLMALPDRLTNKKHLLDLIKVMAASPVSMPGTSPEQKPLNPNTAPAAPKNAADVLDKKMRDQMQKDKPTEGDDMSKTVKDFLAETDPRVEAQTALLQKLNAKYTVPMTLDRQGLRDLLNDVKWINNQQKRSLQTPAKAPEAVREGPNILQIGKTYRREWEKVRSIIGGNGALNRPNGRITAALRPVLAQLMCLQNMIKNHVQNVPGYPQTATWKMPDIEELMHKNNLGKYSLIWSSAANEIQNFREVKKGEVVVNDFDKQTKQWTRYTAEQDGPAGAVMASMKGNVESPMFVGTRKESEQWRRKQENLPPLDEQNWQWQNGQGQYGREPLNTLPPTSRKGNTAQPLPFNPKDSVNAPVQRMPSAMPAAPSRPRDGGIRGVRSAAPMDESSSTGSVELNGASMAPDFQREPDAKNLESKQRSLGLRMGELKNRAFLRTVSGQPAVYSFNHDPNNFTSRILLTLPPEYGSQVIDFDTIRGTVTVSGNTGANAYELLVNAGVDISTTEMGRAQGSGRALRPTQGYDVVTLRFTRPGRFNFSTRGVNDRMQYSGPVEVVQDVYQEQRKFVEAQSVAVDKWAPLQSGLPGVLYRYNSSDRTFYAQTNDPSTGAKVFMKISPDYYWSKCPEPDFSNVDKARETAHVSLLTKIDAVSFAKLSPDVQKNLQDALNEAKTLKPDSNGVLRTSNGREFTVADGKLLTRGNQKEGTYSAKWRNVANLEEVYVGEANPVRSGTEAIAAVNLKKSSSPETTGEIQLQLKTVETDIKSAEKEIEDLKKQIGTDGDIRELMLQIEKVQDKIKKLRQKKDALMEKGK